MKNIEVFEGKNLAKLLKDIYDNSITKRSEIREHINGLMTHIKDVSDASVIAPIVASFLDVGVRNDEQLIKIATVVQRLASSEMQNAGNENGAILTDEDRERLLSDAMADMELEVKKIDQDYKDLKTKAPN